MDMRIITLVATIWASAAAAQDWAVMTGDQISAALTDQTVTYDGARQDFFASGRTLYDAGGESWGTWAVRGDQYCSQWPPSDRWDCYDMTRDGNSVRFLDGFGNVSEGTLGVPE